MSNKSIHIQPKYLSSPSYKSRHSLGYKIALGTVALFVMAAVIIGGITVN